MAKKPFPPEAEKFLIENARLKSDPILFGQILVLSFQVLVIIDSILNILIMQKVTKLLLVIQQEHHPKQVQQYKIFQVQTMKKMKKIATFQQYQLLLDQPKFKK
ncbi:hypothetical protein ACTFIW_007320 [Dictyostelium discoideum]